MRVQGGAPRALPSLVACILVALSRACASEPSPQKVKAGWRIAGWTWSQQ
jgi:hypothetical protein